MDRMKNPLIWLVAILFTVAAESSLIPVSTRVSGPVQAITGDGASGAGEFGGGNRFVFFMSSAGNLVSEGSRGRELNLYRRDRVDGRTELISATGSGVSGAGRVEDYSVSSDGRRIAFTWSTDDPAAGDTNGVTDVYLRDLESGTTRLVSVARSGMASGNGESSAPDISSDGRFVLFESRATDLSADDDTNGVRDVFLRDVEHGTTERISCGQGAATPRQVIRPTMGSSARMDRWLFLSVTPGIWLRWKATELDC